MTRGRTTIVSIRLATDLEPVDLGQWLIVVVVMIMINIIIFIVTVGIDFVTRVGGSGSLLVYYFVACGIIGHLLVISFGLLDVGASVVVTCCFGSWLLVVLIYIVAVASVAAAAAATDAVGALEGGRGRVSVGVVVEVGHFVEN